MATKDDTTRSRVETIKSEVRAVASCTPKTVATLQQLLQKNNGGPTQKENARTKAQPPSRRTKGATAVVNTELGKETPAILAPREKYILATEVANLALKSLAEALKTPPNTCNARVTPPAKPSTAHAKKASAAKTPLLERSVSQITNSPTKRSVVKSADETPSPDNGLIATAECARAAFAYLGTAEALKILGKDSQELQVENGMLALIGKLVALGLDGLATKEIKILKKRLEKYLGHDAEPDDGLNEAPTKGRQRAVPAEKEHLASLLQFGAVALESPAISLVANLQTYVLRIVARNNRVHTVEALWEHLTLANPSSPANLMYNMASTTQNGAKISRQLDSLAQTILVLCPSISRSHDDKPSMPSPDTIILLQHLAFKIKKSWWAIAGHQGQEEKEVLEPFAKCLVAFARRSQSSPSKKYRVALSLLEDLGVQAGSTHIAAGTHSLISKTLSSLAQAAGLSAEALEWLHQENSSPKDVEQPAKNIARLVRIATVSLDALLKEKKATNLDDTISDALEAMVSRGNELNFGTDSLYMEVDALRRVTTRLLMLDSLGSISENAAVSSEEILLKVIASCVHFMTRLIVPILGAVRHAKSPLRDNDKGIMVVKNVKSVVDSIVGSCKRMQPSENDWNQLDIMIKGCVQMLEIIKEEGTVSDCESSDFAFRQSLIVKLSNIYWTIHLKMRKAEHTNQISTIAMRRSVDLLQSEDKDTWAAGNLMTKLEQLADALDTFQQAESSRQAYRQCIYAYIQSDIARNLPFLAAKEPLHYIWKDEGPLHSIARLLKALHRSFIKYHPSESEQDAFYDDCELQSETRGILLEFQLVLYHRTLSKNRQWDGGLNPSISSMVERLLSLYVPDLYPIRRLRLQVALLSLAQAHENILPAELLSVVTDLGALDPKVSKDMDLVPYQAHLHALYRMKLSIQQSGAAVPALRESLATWEVLVSESTSWEQLLQRVDNTEDWLQDIQTCVDYLNAKGEEYLSLPALVLLVKTEELQGKTDTSELVKHMCALALHSLRLGYTGKAGVTLARAEALLGSKMISVEVRLQWHIAYAEYLARIGNLSKSDSIMSAAQKLAYADGDFMKLADYSTTMSGRLRFNRILADASYVQALSATRKGNYKEGARHARQCVTLNRRIWAALESRANMKKAASIDATGSTTDEPSSSIFDPLNSLSSDKKTPLVMSVTHDALNGADFWSLVPALYRGLMQHSQIFAHQGLFQEALQVAEQAEKIAAATGSATLMIDNASWRADCLAQSGRPDKAHSILESLDAVPSRKCLSLAGYHSARARIHHWNRQYDEEISSYDVLNKLMAYLTSPMFIKSLDKLNPDIDSLVEQTSTMTLNAEGPLTKKTQASARGRKPVPKAPIQTKTVPKSRTRSKPLLIAKKGKEPSADPESTPTASSQATKSIDPCSTLRAFQSELLHRNVLANVVEENLTKAVEIMQRLEDVDAGVIQDPSHQWARFKTRLACVFQQMAGNFTVNTLPESTIAFPAVGIQEVPLVGNSTTKRIKGPTATSKGKGARAKSDKSEEFIDQLQAARNLLADAHTASAFSGPNHIFRQVSAALSNITVLLSAVYHGDSCFSMSPQYAAYMSELPRINALRLAHESVEVEKEQLSRDECLKWPELTTAHQAIASMSDFEAQYIENIPDTWTAISLALNDTCDELYITRYNSGASPFVLRLPLARQASREMDEDEFTFQDGKRDFEEIIELNDFSTRTAKDMTSKAARQQWWAEREALDNRLHELLINIENIWLGGFKGVFSQHERQPDLLLRFRKSFDNILSRHLPSRNKKSTQKRPELDNQVLELFIGLGNALDEELDLDEALSDLIYFIVDILHFNGECNASDEIDFDAMVVETREALRAYYSALRITEETSRHVILILDNNLHGFPWESLPCLKDVSISRLPSLASLRERLLALRPSNDHKNTTPGHYIQAQSGGASILNPSGDLSHTLKTIQPRLDDLDGPWKHMANRAPSEQDFETALQDKDLVLYFGHGSGAQYIRTRTVRRLYSPHANTARCATTFLFGCSSAHLSENGIFEPSGMLASYLTAGAPAVLGMLWDVTDKDCDRFAVKAGELWGLWPEHQHHQQQHQHQQNQQHHDAAAPVALPKTPKRKGRVAQLVHGVEGAKTPGSAGRGRRKKVENGESEFVETKRRARGLDECVKEAREACVLRYLNGAAAVVYGIPVYLEK